MTLLSNRLFALALGFSIAGALVVVVYEDPGSGPDLVLVEADVEGARAALETEREVGEPDGTGEAKAGVEVDPAAPWMAWRYYLPENAARKLLPQLEDPKEAYDPWCGYVYRPNFVDRRTWPEHPDGKYEKRMNSLGIQRDGEAASVKPATRIVVTGDSHIDGICNTEEGFPMLLEGALGKTWGEDQVEVLNVAKGGYSFLQYLGSFERMLWLGLKPDLFVVTFFCGNDFSESEYMWSFHEWTDRKREAVASFEDRMERLRAARGEMVKAYGQCLTSASFLHVYPGEQEFLLRITLEATDELRTRCREEGVELLVVLLPSPSDFREQANRGLIERGLEYAGLAQEDLDRLTELREGYARWLADQGIAHLDLFEAFAGHEGLLYWESDLHLNLEGHRLAAREVESRVRLILDR